jgi:uncharacterized delta-60 repeat protein
VHLAADSTATKKHPCQLQNSVKHRGTPLTGEQKRRKMAISSIVLLLSCNLLLLIDVVGAELPPAALSEARADGDFSRVRARYGPEASIFAYVPSWEDKDSELFRPQTSCAGPDTRCTWEHTFGGVLQDKAYGVVSLPDDGLVVVGNSRSKRDLEYNAWILRLSRGGKLIWERSFGGSKSDQVYAVAATQDGGIAVVGHTRSKGAGQSDVWLLRLSETGDLLWERTFGGAQNDRARTIVAMEDGSFVVAGMTRSYGSSQGDAWILKVDNSGDLLWERTFGGDEEYAIFSIAAMPDSGIIATGYVDEGDSFGFELWVIRLNPQGERLWDRKYGRGVFDAGTAITATEDNGAIVAGVTSKDGFRSDDAWVLRLNASGDIVWDQTFGGPEPDSAWAVVEMPGTGYAVTIATLSYGAGSSDAWLICLNDDGRLVWQRIYGGKLWDRPTTAARTQDGGLLVAGYTTTIGEGHEDFWLIRLDARGRF